MESKEALEILFAGYYYNGNYQEVIEAREKLEKDLDRLEKLEKVIDILENKIVNILILKYCIAKGGGVETYNLHYKTEEQITQEEYDLLKEVFGNE